MFSSRSVVVRQNAIRQLLGLLVVIVMMTLTAAASANTVEGEPVGACCFGPNGACAQVTQADCQALSGFFWGPGTDCSLCEQTGRCCIYQDNVPTCQELRLWECAQIPNWGYWGSNSDCSTPCEPMGACCADGYCYQSPEFLCLAFPGQTWLGEGTSCDDCGQSQNTGMCCIDTDKRGYTCIETTFEDCVFNQGGEFYGVGVLCDDQYFCGDFSEAGACCLPGGGCIYTTADLCEFTYSGSFQGEGVWCIDVACGSDVGACCLDGGTSCQLLTQSECDALKGSFAGPGTQCDFESCPDLLGSCCLQDPTGSSYCDVLTIFDCFSTPGAAFWSIGNFAPCTFPCPDFGACCTADGFCYTTEPEVCVNIYNGTFKGIGTTCFDTDNNGVSDGCERPGDVNGDGVVNVTDLLAVIGQWGTCPPPCPADVAPWPTGDGAVNVSDLLLVIGNWG